MPFLCCGKQEKVVQPLPTDETIENLVQKPQRILDYSIKVKTGNEPNSGTNGPVFISIFGDENKSIENILLQQSEDEKSFEIDSLKTIRIKQIDIGQLKRIRIEHQDQTNGWFLEYVEITVRDRTTRFVANRWLNLNENDKKSSVELYGSEKGDREYEIEVKTGDDQVEPLDSAVYAKIIGTDGETPKLFLVNKNGSFPKDSKEHFKVSSIDVGEVKKILIGHEGNGENNDWFLEYFKLRSNDENFDFSINKWLSPTKDEQKLSVEMECKSKLSPIELENFLIKIKTIDVEEIEGLKNVELSLFGTNDKIEQIPIDDQFEKENLVELNFQEKNIGEIKNLKIGFKSNNLETAWLLESIEINYQKKIYYFNVDCWLTNRLGPEFSSIVLKPNDENEDFVNYKIEVETGESAVDSNVSLCIFGDKKITKILPLRTAKFQKQSQVEFNIKTSDVGKIEKINIGHDGKIDQWFLKTVFIEKNGEKETFKANQWLSKKSQNFIDLFPLSSTQSVVPRSVIYLITVETSSEKNSGTDSNVFMTIFGENQKTKEFQLKRSDRYSNILFQQGQTDFFNFELIDVGNIKKINVRQDGNGFHPKWNLKKIQIQKETEFYTFEAEKILEDPQLNVDLEPTPQKSRPKSSSSDVSDDSELKEVKYNVILKRPIRRDSLNGNPFIVIVGTDGETKKMEIPENSDVFELFGKDVGKIQRAFLVMGNDEIDVIFYNDNIIIKKGDDITRLINGETSKNRIEFTSIDCEYFVKITTADKNFDVPVTMKIRGFEGSITFPLTKTKNGAKPFQSKATDEFVRIDTDVGKIKQIILLHESKEKEDFWKIKRIQIIKGNEIYNFLSNQHMDSKQQKLVLRPLVEHKEDYVESELHRLKTKLRCESSKMRRTKQKPFTPYVYNDLRPYFDTTSVDKAIAEPLECPTGYYTRVTALRVVEPWESYGMDYGVNYELYNPRASRIRSAKSESVTQNGMMILPPISLPLGGQITHVSPVKSPHSSSAKSTSRKTK